MSDENLLSKIELLEEQLENFERSGFFTEKEIDKYSTWLKAEIAAHKSLLKPNEMEESAAVLNKVSKELYGMTPEDYVEGMKYHNECFDLINAKNVLEIEVNNPKIINQKAS